MSIYLTSTASSSVVSSPSYVNYVLSPKNTVMFNSNQCYQYNLLFLKSSFVDSTIGGTNTQMSWLSLPGIFKMAWWLVFLFNIPMIEPFFLHLIAAHSISELHTLLISRMEFCKVQIYKLIANSEARYTTSFTFYLLWNLCHLQKKKIYFQVWYGNWVSRKFNGNWSQNKYYHQKRNDLQYSRWSVGSY